MTFLPCSIQQKEKMEKEIREKEAAEKQRKELELREQKQREQEERQRIENERKRQEELQKVEKEKKIILFILDAASTITFVLLFYLSLKPWAGEHPAREPRASK